MGVHACACMHVWRPGVDGENHLGQASTVCFEAELTGMAAVTSQLALGSFVSASVARTKGKPS